MNTKVAYRDGLQAKVNTLREKELLWRKKPTSIKPRLEICWRWNFQRMFVLHQMEPRSPSRCQGPTGRTTAMKVIATEVGIRLDLAKVLETIFVPVHEGFKQR